MKRKRVLIMGAAGRDLRSFDAVPENALDARMRDAAVDAVTLAYSVLAHAEREARLTGLDGADNDFPLARSGPHIGIVDVT